MHQAGGHGAGPRTTSPLEATARTTGYRPDIDGLRAVAVLAVVAYHLGLGAGGYVGVDIFFVISGFLITRILAGEMAAGTFGWRSIARFYERRIRRIAPALTAVCAVTTIFSLLVLFPEDLKEFGRSLESVAIFISNIHFQRKTGYFDGAADEKPLLHTWSLAVEEQYYLAFPLLLWFVWRLGGRQAAVLVCLAVAALSLIYGEMFVRADAAQAFFSTPARIWELLAGAVLALSHDRLPSARIVREGMALAGMALIALTLTTYTPETAFPGLGAVFPVAGSALIIAAGAKGANAVSYLLRAAPLVGVGLISYSVYLWHWPILVLAKYRFGPLLEAHPVAASCVLFVLSLGAGYLSWRFVEQPFRKPAPQDRQRPAFVAQAIAMIASVGAGAALAATHGLPGRWPAETMALIDPRPTKVQPRGMDCRPAAAGAPSHVLVCGAPGGDLLSKPMILLWGDSHAAMLRGTFARSAPDGVVLATSIIAGCPPLSGVVLGGRDRSERCRVANAQTLAYVAQAGRRISRIILVARWPYYAEGTRMRFEQGQRVDLGGAPGETPGAVLTALLGRTVTSLLAHVDHIVILAPFPEFDRAVATSLAKAHAWGHPPPDDPSRLAVERRQRTALAAIAAARALAPERITIVSPLPLFCRAGSCPATDADGTPLYRDTNHLSARGLERVTRLFKPFFGERE